MKAKELIKLFSEYPDFDVVLYFMEEDNPEYEYGICLSAFTLTGVYDIGYSKKQIALDIKETDA